MRIIRIILALFLSSFVLSQETKGSFGSVVIDGETYNQASVRPEFKVSNLAVALDIYFYFNSKGIKMDTWDFSDGKSAYRTLIDKIYYLKWGEPSDNFYFMFGSLPSVTMGQGILVGGYSNAIDYPSERRSGLDLKVRGYGVGLEAIYSDFKKNSPGLAGARLSYSPINKIEFGVSYAKDMNQFSGLADADEDGYPDVYDKYPDDEQKYSEFEENKSFWYENYTSLCGIEGCPDMPFENWFEGVKGNEFSLSDQDEDPVSGFGFDVIYKATDWLSAYGQYASLRGEYLDPLNPVDREGIEQKSNLGYGFSFPGIHADLGFFSLRAEYRQSSRGFTFGYWDRSYETNRVQVAVEEGGDNSIITKESQLYNFGELKGFFVQFNSSLLNAINFDMSYQDMSGEKWENSNSDDLGVYVEDSNKSFTAVLSILPSFIPKVNKLEAFYQQKNVPNPFDFVQDLSTISGVSASVEMTGGMVLVYTQTTSYIKNLDSGSLEPVTSVNIETQMSF